MTEKNDRLLSLADIEGKTSPHQLQVKGALKMRAAPLEYVKDVEALAAFLGGRLERPNIGEDWAVSKEVFPGVHVCFVFNGSDDEFPARLRALYSGDKIRMIKGDELATITVSLANQLLRYVREANPGVKLPDVCYRV
jgi:hypothetical protein